LASLDFNKT